MKKSLLALAALTAFAGVASAQSSVTLFGVVDQAFYNVKNGSVTQKGLASNQLNSNRLGFRGVEDLGGGLRAGFWLEAGMNTDTGVVGGANGQPTPANGTSFFNRRSTVSLMGGFGELRLGRDYTPSFWNYTIFDPFGTNGPGAMSNIVADTLGSTASTWVRANNSVGYFLPAMGGVYGQFMAAAAEGTASPNGNKYVGGRLGFAGGPVNVAVATGKTYADGSPGMLNSDFKDTNVGGSVVFGIATVMAQYSKRDWLNRDQKTTMVGVNLALGAGNLKASITNSKGAQGSSARDFDAKQVAVGYDYSLSKRTVLHGTYSSLNNDGNALTGSQFAIGLGTAVPGGDNSKGFAVGVRHSF